MSDLLAALGEPADALIFVDFETYYDREYQLRKLSTAEYITDERFEVIGVSVKVGNRPAIWMEEPEFRRWAATVPWHRVAVGAHNYAFDGAILSWRYGIVPAFMICTLSLARPIHGTSVGGSLKKLSDHYAVGQKGDEVINALGKRRVDFSAEEIARYAAYCCNDTELASRLLWKMIDLIPELELWGIDSTLRFFVERLFVGDQEKLAQAVEDERAKKAALLERVSADRSVLMSNEQFAALLADMGVDPPKKLSVKKTATARKKDPEAADVYSFAFSKSDPGFKDLLEHEDENVRWLAEARTGVRSTGTQTRAQRLLDMARRGPLPVFLKYHGAHTGRWSAGDKTNFQNLERTNKKNPAKGAIRKALRAPPGHVVVAADSGAIEARKLAWLSGHNELVLAFAQNRDVYSEFATVAYGRHVDRKANPIEDEIPGHVGKTCILGLGYMMGPAKLAQSLLSGANGGPAVQFTMAEATALHVGVADLADDDYHVKRVRDMPTRLSFKDMFVHYAVSKTLVDRYRETNAPIVAFWATLETALEAMYRGQEFRFGPNGCLRTVENGIVLPSGRMLRYPGLSMDKRGFSCWGGPGGKHRVALYGGKLVENVTQAMSRDVILEQLLWVRVEKYPVATTTHDEIVPIVRAELGPAALRRTLEIMRIAPPWAPGLPLKAEGGINEVYGLAK